MIEHGKRNSCERFRWPVILLRAAVHLFGPYRSVPQTFTRTLQSFLQNRGFVIEEVAVRPRSPRGQPTKRDSCFLQIAYSCEDIIDSAESIKLVSIASSAFPHTAAETYVE